jgi:hypothetical protein
MRHLPIYKRETDELAGALRIVRSTNPGFPAAIKLRVNVLHKMNTKDR